VARTVRIDDADDPRVAPYRDVRDAALRARQGLFVVEGELVLRRALDAPVRLRSVLVTPPRLAALADVLAGLGGDVPVYVADQSVMSAVAGFDIHRGVLAVAERPPAQRPLDVVGGCDRVALVEGLTDHENVGAVFRTAAALGVGAVLLDPRCGDPLYRRSVRVSMGHALALPWARTGPWPAALADLRAAGFSLVALTPRGEEVLDEVAPRPGGRLAVLLGAEGAGLGPGALAAADRRVRIPMAAGVDSLNVATAAAIAFHHLRPRDRRS
jgi:tRNA G18 (ribose-2'-O)-methylase SpoU